MNKILITILLFLLIPFVGYSQSYTGKVIDEERNPICFANIAVFSSVDSTLISGTITDDNGKFKLKGIYEKDIYIDISFLGFLKRQIIPTQNDLGEIILSGDEFTLSEVVVSGEKQIFKQEYDKLIFNVSSSPLKEGYDGLEVLKRTPKLQVNSQGTILLRNSSVLVLVNGRKMNMSGEELSSYLSSIDSENIKSIEINDIGSAETDASNSGGVVNIVLKKVPTGFQSSVKGYYIHRNKDNQVYFGGITNQFGSKKWNIYNIINFSDDDNLSEYNSTTQFHGTEARNVNDGFSESKHRNFNTTTGIVYYPNEKHEVGLEGYYNNSKSNQNGIETINIFNPDLEAVANNTQVTKTTADFYDIALNYTYKLDSLGSKLKFISDIGNNKMNNNNEVNTIYGFGNIDNNHNQFITNSNSNFYNIQTDWNQKLKSNLEFSLGAKWSNVSRGNILQTSLFENGWQPTVSGQEDFDNNENVFANYLSVATKIKNKHQIKVGLRTEYTDIKGKDFINNTEVEKDYFDCFPNLFYAYELKNNQLFSFSYSKRISRPSFRDLNPFVVKQNDFLYQMGNPDLQPQYTNKFDLTYQRKNQSISLYADYIVDYITGVYTAQENVSYYMPQNFGKKRDVGIDYSYYGDLTKWLYANISLGAWHNNFTAQQLQYDKYSYYLSIYSQLKFKKSFFLNISTSYYSKIQFGVTESAEQYRLNLSLQKNIWNGVGLVRIACEDVFNTSRDKNISYYRDFNFSFYQKRLTRSFILVFVYTFKNKGQFNERNVQKNNDNKGRL